MPYDIEFRDDLPKTLVGKVAYRVLEEEMEKSAPAAAVATAAASNAMRGSSARYDMPEEKPRNSSSTLFF